METSIDKCLGLVWAERNVVLNLGNENVIILKWYRYIDFFIIIYLFIYLFCPFQGNVEELHDLISTRQLQ